MILFGKQLTAADQPMMKVKVEKIYHALLNPKDETLAMIRRLRLVRQMDPKKYSELKRQLPFFVCGIFAPPFRRSENFAYTEYFILDIDKLSQKQLNPDELKKRIVADSRVVMCFVSPSEDGIKIMFRLKERCFDKGLYSLFYRTFAQKFAQQYSLQQVIDSKTCDVARACFVSYDPKAYYNPQADAIDINVFLPQDDSTAMLDLRHYVEIVEKQQQHQQPQEMQPKTDVDDEVIDKIKILLGERSAKKPEKNVYVPVQLNEIMDDLCKYVTDTGLEITEIINISYGKKIRMRLRLKQAEVNLFYGKKGFSVTISPRTGTDNELNELAAKLIQSFINGQ